jgi:hypothetical protein
MYRSAVSPRWDITEAEWIDHRPNPRFAIFDVRTKGTGDDVVFDKETGLIWERSPSTDKKPNWSAAVVYSLSSVRGGRKGWRLPTIEELLSLVDPARASPTLPGGHPFENLRFDDYYWSCTLGLSNPPATVWGYNFGNGDTASTQKDVPGYVWLVRGGFGHDLPF